MMFHPSHSRHAALAAILALVAIGSGCVLPDQVTGVQKDLAAVRDELQRVRESQDQTNERIADLEDRVDQRETGEEAITREDIADLKSSLTDIARNSRVYDERMTEIDRRLDRLGEETRQIREFARQSTFNASSNPPAGDPTATPAGPDQAEPVVGTLPDSASLYNTAYTDFMKGNYDLARSGFQEFHQQFPDSADADNALYWVAECHFSQGSFEESIRAIDRMLELYPGSERAPAGNFKKALAYLEQNKVSPAILQFRLVRQEYPRSDEARLAAEKLRSLGSPL